MKDITIYGSAFGNSGYAHHVRNLAFALGKLANVRVESPLPAQWTLQCPSWLREMIDKPDKNDVVIFVGQPHYFGYKLSDRPNKFLGYCVFEGDTVPECWKENCSDPRIDTIIVPSTHCKEALGIDCVVIPHGYDPEVYNDKVVAEKEDKFTFLFVGGWSQGENDRKNLPLLLRAFTEEFKEDENVQLKVHINAAYNPPGWSIENELSKLGIKKHKGVKFNLAPISDKDMAVMHKSADVFVGPARAEGFGFSFLQSMVVGTPVICTGFGGQTDFVNNKNGWVITKGKMFESKDKENLYRGVNWFECDQKALQLVMRQVYTEKDTLESIGKQAKQDIKHLTWDNTAKLILECLL